MKKMTYEEWLDSHEEELFIKFAETGMDRELDFDMELEIEKEYEKYLNKTYLDKLPTGLYEGGHY